ncbi:MAG: CBS domain-containing protein [Acidimicrobiia bacterium]|nr:CBS domain-containing protein [Acidimicrobiia bacterium]
MHVVDLMTSDLITVTPDTPIREAANLMSLHRVSGLPVCDAVSCLVGIITEADFLRLEVARQEAEHPTPIERVADVMTTDIVTIRPDRLVSDAARMMVINDVNRLPVVDERNTLLGVISRMDVVGAFARPDDVIEDEVREDLLRRVLFVDPESIEVAVVDGVVSFDGVIGTRTEAEMLDELVLRLPGVTRVVNRLAWRVDDRTAL